MKQIVVIGAGPAGIEAAKTAALAGQDVTLVSDALVGGRAGWHSLLPSKVWLTAADSLGLLAEAEKLGIAVGEPRIERAAVLARIKQVKDSWNHSQKAQLDVAGVKFVPGIAAFRGPNKVDVRDPDGAVVTTLQADAFIVSPGSTPRFPANLKPDGKRVIAPRFASHLADLPHSIVVIGAGPTGCEFAYLFNRVGVHVTWIVDAFGILPQFHPDAGRALGLALVRQGVHMVQGQFADRIERGEDGVAIVLQDEARYEADMAFVAIGRNPDWSRLNLGAAGLKSETGVIAKDGYGRCFENPQIYLVGDADGGWMVANKAFVQARIAARHAANLPTSLYNPNAIVLAAYTEPQAAQVGQVREVEDAKRVRVGFHTALKAHLLPDGDGFVELVYRGADKKVLGATAVGPHAADVLAPVALAISVGANVDNLAEIYSAHPTLSELAFIAARAAG